MHIRQILESLNRFPHRGSATLQEKAAAEFIKQSLKQAGLSAQIESFKAISSYSWEIVPTALLIAGGVMMAPWLSKLGAALALLGCWSYLRHFMGRATLFRAFIPKKTSQNVFSKIPANESATPKNIIIMAHYDTARASAVFHPKRVKDFRKTFLFNTYLSFFTIPWAYLGDVWGQHLIYLIVCLLLAAIQLSNIGIQLHREIFHRFVPGMNDNGSGVAAAFAILDHFQKNPIRNYNLWLVFTGCEEAGIQGAHYFLDQHRHELSPANSVLINLDNVGQGQLYYVTGEGMILYHHYDERLVEQCRQLTTRPRFSAIRPLEYRQAYFDTLVFTQHNYPCTTLVALDREGRIPNWHWYSDTIDKIDENTIRVAADFSIALIRSLTTNTSSLV